ncbi:MAG: IS66 family transposase [Pirellulales bacterium]
MIQTTLDIPLSPGLTEEQARAIVAQGHDAVVFALLQLAQLWGEERAARAGDSHATPATPSGMKPPFSKDNLSSGRKKKPGRKTGHPGSRRDPPAQANAWKTHRADVCPDCGGPLNRCSETRTRQTEDIPEEITPVVTEHTIHRDWCSKCKKKVEPPVTDALPNSTLGNRLLVLTAWLHYALGNTISQIIEVFNYHLQIKLSAGGLVQMWQRLAEIVYPWYEQIQQEALNSAVLHADESGWRVNGKTLWLWCFANPSLSYFMINRSRGSPALMKFFIQEFKGTLVSDFWAAYNAVACARRQMCLVHLLRDLEMVEKYKSPSAHWPAFAKKLRRLIGDAIRLHKRENVSSDEHASRRRRLTARLDALIATEWNDVQARRLIKRLRRHANALFTFLDQPDVPFDNNLAERAIRPAVIIRKNSYGNRSDNGADVQAILMSIFFTLKKRGHNPVATLKNAVETYLKTNTLPTLPPQTTADG